MENNACPECGLDSGGGLCTACQNRILNDLNDDE